MNCEQAKRLGHFFRMGVAFSYGRRFANDSSKSLAEDAKVKDQGITWITVKGTHIPIKNGRPNSSLGKQILSSAKTEKSEQSEKKLEQLHSYLSSTKGSDRNRSDRASRYQREKILAAKRANASDFLKRTYAKIAKAETDTSKILADVTSQVNDATLIGFEYRLKDLKSLARKVRTKIAKDIELRKNPRAEKKVMDGIDDVIRYTQQSPADKLVNNFEKTIDKFKSLGYKVNVDNKWNDDSSVYKGLHATLESPSGVRFELQFHTPEGMKIKAQLHKYYEVYRDEERSDKDRLDAWLAQREIANGYVKPKDIGRVINS